MRKMKNNILAIPAAAAEMPVNPKSPEINATIRKNIANFNILMTPVYFVSMI